VFDVAVLEILEAEAFLQRALGAVQELVLFQGFPIIPKQQELLCGVAYQPGVSAGPAG
jgi:hypothetical protein